MIGLRPNKNWYEHFVWVCDSRARQIGWYVLPCSPAQQSVGLGWLPNTHTLVGLNVTYAGAGAPRAAGTYLWTLDTEAKAGFQFRRLQGPAAAAALSFDNWHRQGPLAFFSASKSKKPPTQALVIVDLATAIASFFPGLAVEGGAWLPSPDGERVAMLELNQVAQVRIYGRAGQARSYALSLVPGRLGPSIAWGPGGQEVTVTSGDRKRPITVINVETGTRRLLIGGRR